MGSKKVNLEEKEDRISALPDSIIQHILSFLPSTKEVVQTGIISKHWQDQWTHVPVLIFKYYWGMSYDSFFKFIEYTLILHDCSKIKKFHLHYGYSNKDQDPQFAAKLRFATRKHVEELSLSPSTQKLLPAFLFNHASLVKLDTYRCTFMPNGRVNWECLTTLDMFDCKLSHRAMEHILSGSPSLKSLKLIYTLYDHQFDKIVIASKSLKILILSQIRFNQDIEISCPNLEKLSLRAITVLDDPELLARAIENVLIGSLLLESFELTDCSFWKLVIASKSLKILVLEGLSATALEIKCPKLERLKRWMLSELEGALLLPTLLNNKCLILSSDDLNRYPCKIARLICNSHVLEELVIKVPHCVYNFGVHYHEGYDYYEKLNDLGENYWTSNKTVFKCLESHLKTIKFIGFPYRDHNRKLVLNFIQFLLKNARLLEKMVVKLMKDETSFMLEISQEVLSLSKYSQHAIIEFQCSERGWSPDD